MAQTKVLLVKEIRQDYEITSISQETLQNLYVVLVQYKIKERKKKRKGS